MELRDGRLIHAQGQGWIVVVPALAVAGRVALALILAALAGLYPAVRAPRGSHRRRSCAACSDLGLGSRLNVGQPHLGREVCPV